MSDDIEEVIVEEIKCSPLISLQLDESTDVASLSQLVCFIQYIKEESLKTEFLFCKELETTTTAEDIFRRLDDYMCAHNIPWNKLVSCTTDGAPAMMGKRNGLLAKIKQVNPNVLGNHCCLHRQSLSSTNMPEELSSVFATVVRAVNFVKSSATNSRLFHKLCGEEESVHGKLLFFDSVRWLSRGACVQRVFELRVELAQFLESRNHSLADFFNDENLAKLAYLADIFAALNDVNRSLQGRSKNIFDALDKIRGFNEKLNLWRRRVETGKYEHFKNLHLLLQTTKAECTFVKAIIEPMCILQDRIAAYFDDDIESMKVKKWMRFPFSDAVDQISDDDFEMKEEIIVMKEDSSLETEFKEIPLPEFWIRRLNHFPKLASAALSVLLIFPTSWECESAFSQIAIMKNKFRNRLCIEADARVALASTEPRIDKLVKAKQHHPSH